MQALIASPPEAPTRKCANCKNPMLAEQEWCLECGAAASRAPSRRAGLRSGLGVAALTLLFVCGAVGASYAALAPTKKRTLRPRVVIAQVTMPAPAPSAASPTVAPGTGAPLANVAPPTTLPATKVPKLPKIPKVPAGATPSVPVVTPHTITPKRIKVPKHTTGTSLGGSNNTSPSTGTILLDTNAASVYNPGGLPATSFGDPAKAVDGDASTAWTYTLDPARAGKVGAGLLIDLKSAHRVKAITLNTPSPGMAVELYGAVTAPTPAAITDPRWIHIGGRAALKDTETVSAKGKGHNFRYLVVWIPRAATGQSTGSVGLSELTVQR